MVVGEEKVSGSRSGNIRCSPGGKDLSSLSYGHPENLLLGETKMLMENFQF